MMVRNRGFTLMEVVISLAILAIGLTIIIELFSGGLRLGRTSKEYTMAVNYARLKLEEIAFKQTLEEGTEEGEFDEPFRWQVGLKKVDILPVGDKSDFKPLIELFQIKVNIIWKSGSQERSVGIESYQTIKLEFGEKKS